MKKGNYSQVILISFIVLVAIVVVVYSNSGCPRGDDCKVLCHDASDCGPSEANVSLCSFGSDICPDIPNTICEFRYNCTNPGTHESECIPVKVICNETCPLGYTDLNISWIGMNVDFLDHEEVNISAEVKNLGGSDLRNQEFYVKFYFDEIRNEEVLVHTGPVYRTDWLAYKTFVLPAGSRFTVTATADSREEVIETDENNNAQTFTFDTPAS